ncbi:hypothetical protein D4764_15G0008840 [Takifugu flavidus]|uniref:Alkylated DNA repair protein AlkB homologue 8 N-terminal domain-containing protein n=1 Tax=Takifugu flavidus TaxID=433684 RepID=A0A5C6P5N6_9TELE|nr:hypothetical protein D4764_15G0008840 [Takifugu flavidus]
MAMELIIRASCWVVGGERLKNGLRLPPIRAYMDDMTTITTTRACTKRLLEKLQKNIQWARMEIKPSKSGSISIVKGQLANDRFHINNEPVPTILEKPIKSLGRWYSAELKDSKQVEQLKQDTISGLRQINSTALPGKLKLWCFQFGLLPRLMWPISIYEVTLSHANRLERLVNVQVRKWLGLPRCLSSIGLYGSGVLSLPVLSLVEEYKCAKARLEMTLTECTMSFPLQPTYISGMEKNQPVHRVQRLQASSTSWRVKINSMPPNSQPVAPWKMSFVRGGEKRGIAVTNLHPDLVLWSKSCRRIFIVELTVPWEEAIGSYCGQNKETELHVETAYRREVARLVSWCGHNLQLNAQKTVEMIVDFRKVTAPLPPLTLMDSPITIADSFRFLGTTITRDLKWEPTISSLIKKAQQRMFFLPQLRKLKLPPRMLAQFYTAIIESILTSSITVWYAGATARDRLRLQRVVRAAEKVIGCRLPSIQDLYISRTRRCAGRITADPSHPGHGLFSPLPSGRRLRSIRTKTSRYMNSFFPSAIRLLNTK